MNAAIEQTIIEQNKHWEAVPYQHVFKRRHDEDAIADLNLDEIQIITGIRRCGKSTLLEVLINHLMETVDPKSILYVNLDDPNYTDLYSNASEMYTLITRVEKLTKRSVKYLFLDEIQNVEAWEKYVKSVYDSRRFKKILVTGSNANLLNSDYANLLSGRYIETRIYPLSFNELLLNNGITDKLQLIKQKAKVLHLIDKMLSLGGFPRIYCIDDLHQQHKVLKSYYETILLKDCIKNHNVRDTNTLTNLAHYLLSHVASTYSYNSLSKALESNENTIKQFVNIFQNAYFINEVKQYSYSLKAQVRAKKKTYCIDNGLITAATFKFSSNYGRLLENLVYTELCKQNLENIYYFNDHNECDFIIHRQKEKLAIQVCYDLTQENRTRELAGLKAVMKNFSIKKGVVITYDQEEQIDNNIAIVPFWKFFF